jgi:hypothetical protein
VTALVVLAAALVVGAIVTSPVPLPAGQPNVPVSDQPLPLPELFPPAQQSVAITVTYQLAPENVDAFLGQAAELRRVRRRTGASHWHLHRALDDPEHFEELFIVGSWEEHERQHDRLRGDDRAVLDTIDTLLAPGEARTARHFAGVRPKRRSPLGGK